MEKKFWTIFLVVVAILGIAFFVNGCHKNPKDTGNKDQDTLGLYEPTNNKNIKVLIDPGHGGFDNGTSGKNTKVKESELNLIVSKLLEKNLIDAGFDVVLTRTDGNALFKDKGSDMQKRKNIIETSGADLVINIHMNYYTDSSVSGPTCFFMPKSETGKKIATTIQESLNSELKPPKPKTVKSQNFFILRAGTMPCVLVECGFLSNSKEEKLLLNSDYQKRLAQAITDGVVDYFSSNLAE